MVAQCRHIDIHKKIADDCAFVQHIVNHQNTHDPQTGLPNLDLLLDRTEACLQQGSACHLLFIIANGVEEIGEYHGFEAALYVLKTISHRLNMGSSKERVAARIHGNLFATLGLSPKAEVFVAELYKTLARPIGWKSEIFQLTIHIGVVKHLDNHQSAQWLIQSGYAAAKESQRNNRRGGFCFFSQKSRESMEKEYQLGAGLQGAIADDSFSLAMQPLVDAKTGALSGAEVLIRWDSAVFGRVSPAEFIPIAERSGAIAEITDWVLKRTIAETRSWLDADCGMHVAVNISAVDLHRTEFVLRVEEVLRRYNIRPNNIVFEITESAISQDPVYAVQQLIALKKMGIKLALDDFGTGYSSLGQLNNLPIDVLKIDKAFISDFSKDHTAKSIVYAIVSLARALNIKTVAEGVETVEQLQFLRDAGVDTLQGYALSSPLKSRDFISLAQSGNPLPWSHLF